MVYKLFVKAFFSIARDGPMGFSAPLDNYLDIIALWPVKIFQGIKTMGLCGPWPDCLDIIAL